MNNFNTILFNLDPMNTTCVENGLTDEYQSEANEIQLLIDGCVPMREAVTYTFNNSFWENCLTSQTIDSICYQMLSINNE